MVDRAVQEPVATPANINLSNESLVTLNRGVAPSSEGPDNRNVIRVTNSVAQYDVSKDNPNALQNLGKAIAGSIDRDDLTYQDSERGQEIRLGDVLITVDLSNPDEIVLCHHDSAAKGPLGRLACSLNYAARNPIHLFAMKALGVVTDPEVVYKQKVTQLLAQLDREGLFGPPGQSTFNLNDWEIDTRAVWRDVVIRRAPKEHLSTPLDLSQLFFSSSRIGVS